MGESTPTLKVLPRRKSGAGASGPTVSVSADFSKGGSSATSRQIVTGAHLGEVFNLSTRSIREHRAAGRIHRLGSGYDYKRSVQGMLDYERIEMLKRALAGRYPEVVGVFDDLLEYRRELAQEHDQLLAAVRTALAHPDLPPAVIDALSPFVAPETEEPDHGA